MALKSHPFFEGIDFQSLNEYEVPLPASLMIQIAEKLGQN